MAFNNVPYRLRTERLILRPITDDDVERCVEMDLDPEVTKYIDGLWDASEQHVSNIKKCILTAYGDGLGYWSLFRKDAPSSFLGWIFLAPDKIGEPEIEIGWRLKRSAWNNGYATEAAQAILQHAFSTIGIECIYAYIDEENKRSLNVAKKIGLQLAKGHADPGLRYSAYRITREDYHLKQQGLNLK